ncbi:hypothetical protein BaRGS_00014247 [Batillaria attramentaria]|uniref:DUF4434 domain-containing protein n=1 Tax=Batillaria attramentaria TaxID=370345 RepID=A0ABD0L4V6_9CAEN
MSALTSLLISTTLVWVAGAAFGPKYPVTASWFRDRFTYQEWNKTLGEFQLQDGDTVFLRAPPVIRRTRDDLARDPNFVWCGGSNSSTGVDGTRCYDEAVQELTSMGLKVVSLATYEYEEGFSETIMMCPQVDRKINSSRIYYRIVLPAGSFNQSAPCDFPSGSSVVVLFTSFAGTDPHSLLLGAAAERKMSVYFGLPAAPQAVSQSDATMSRGPFKQGSGRGLGEFDTDLMAAYYGWVFRVVHEHQARYSNITSHNHVHTATRSARQSVYTSLAGYYVVDECCLPQINASSPYVDLYTQLGRTVHGMTGKRLAISPFIGLNRAQFNATVEQHVQGFETLAGTGQIDVIAVQEGRGVGIGCYYWPTQRHLAISQVDKTLDKILHYQNPDLKPNLFAALEKSRDGLVGRKSNQLELWLNLEAFEYLRDDPCLPVDPASSGMGELLNRASKNRLDRGLAAASVRVQKVISFAWDPDYTCSTNQYRTSLAQDIRAQSGRPMIASCSFHSPANRSVVVIGYNLEGMQQGFEVNWPSGGKRQKSSLYGYYFELDWGAENNRVPSLMYTQLYDPPYIQQLDNKGWVSVKAQNAANGCIFLYDFTRSKQQWKASHGKLRN